MNPMASSNFLSSDRSLSGKAVITASLIRHFLGSNFRRILVVGCGSGLEAAALAQGFQAEVIGIDLDPSFDIRAAEWADLRKGDATHLEFDSGFFDLVYCFHVLEHIPDYQKALSEMARVLRPMGGVLVGTPNQARLIGYLGSETAAWNQKIAWNWNDWKAKIRGQFKNELGAHAGFLPRELKGALEEAFEQVEDITFAYYLQLYQKSRLLIKFLGHSGLGHYLFPAIYFVGRK